MNKSRDWLTGILITITLASCGGDDDRQTQYTIGGTVNGLSGSGLVLQTPGAGSVTVAPGNSFQFPTAVVQGTAYTVTVQTQPTNPSQTCAVTGATGSGTVGNANVTNVAVTCTTNTYKVGGTVRGLQGTGLTLQKSGGDFLPIAADGTFTFATSVASGAIYTVTVISQPTPAPGSAQQNCSVSPDTSRMGGADVTSIAVVCVSNAARFVYVVNSGTNDVSGYAINYASGALTALSGSPFAVGNKPTSLTLHPSGKFAYVSNSGANTISAFTVDATSGTLTSIGNSPTLVTPVSKVDSPLAPVEIDPSGNFAIVGNPNAPIVGDGQPNNLAVYRIDTASGMLTPIAGSPFTTNAVFPDFVAIDSAGKFAYAFNYILRVGAGGLSISSFAIDSSAGTLTAVSGSPFGPFEAFPLSYHLSPNRSLAYAGFITRGVHSFLLDGATGVVTAGAITPFGANALTTDPSGKFIYVTDGDGVAGYIVDSATGAFTAISGTPITLSRSAGLIAMNVDPTGKFLYATAADGIYAWTIDPSSGSLTAVPGSPFAAPVPSDRLSQSVAIDPSGSYLYVPSSALNNLYALAIDPVTGALTPVNGSPFKAGSAPGQIVFLN